MKMFDAEFYEPTPMLRELQILTILAENPGVSQKEISSRVAIVPSMVHNYLHGLAGKGLIDFQGPSRRRMRYILTQAGEERLRSLSGRHAEEACRVLEGIADWIRAEMKRAVGDGVRRIGVLNCPALGETLERVGKETGIEVKPLGGGSTSEGAFSGESLAGLDAVLVMTDPGRQETQRVIAVAGERGLPVYRLG